MTARGAPVRPQRWKKQAAEVGRQLRGAHQRHDVQGDHGQRAHRQCHVDGTDLRAETDHSESPAEGQPDRQSRRHEHQRNQADERLTAVHPFMAATM